MKNEYLYGIAGIVLGSILAMGIMHQTQKNTHHNTGSRDTMQHDATAMDSSSAMMDHGMSNSMDSMTSGLKNKKGSDFDKAFISEMIVHHQGAIDMANLANENAEHQEIKDLAKAIIQAQTVEINQMKAWQTNWFNN